MYLLVSVGDTTASIQFNLHTNVICNSQITISVNAKKQLLRITGKKMHTDKAKPTSDVVQFGNFSALHLKKFKIKKLSKKTKFKTKTKNY